MELIVALPSAVTMPCDGHDDLAKLTGANILRVGTTIPDVFAGGRLTIDYLNSTSRPQRIILAFSERGMWIEAMLSLSS